MRLWLLLLLFLSTLLWAGPPLVQGAECVSPAGVVVHGADAAFQKEICAAAAKGIAFLAQYGLGPQGTITIDLVEDEIDNHGFIAFGRYEIETRRIELMSFRAILAGAEQPLMFGEPLDRVHYAGLVAHEVAHAIVEPNLRRKKYSITPQEYLAYATQLAVLPQKRRRQVIAAMEVGPWEGGDYISNIYMAMNPGRFAVKSYLHLVSLADPKAFVRQLLDARSRDIHVPKAAAGKPGA